MAENNTEVPKWNYEGKEYPMFIADSTDSIGVEIRKQSDDTHPIGILVSNFKWEKSEAFIDRLDYELEDKRDKENFVERHRANIDRLNAHCFDEITTGGKLIKLVDGIEDSSVDLSHEDMLRRTTELKSNSINQWIKNFHIERFFDKGVDELDALTTASVDSVKFVCKIGDQKNPSSVLLLEFAVPSDDARRAFDDNRTKSQSKYENNVETIYTAIDWKRKIQYAKKHLRFASGAAVLIDGQIVPVTDSPDALKQFKDSFNPDWFMQLGDALQDSFNIGGK